MNDTPPVSQPKSTSILTGVPEALAGVIIFSLTTPAMKVAVQSFDPVVVGVGRILLPVIPAIIVLLCLRAPLPTWRQFRALAVTSACIVFGFSWLIAAALHEVPSFHASIVIGGIPLATAVAARLRGGAKQPALFWAAAITGFLLVSGYGFAKSGWQVSSADILLLVAATFCGLGYSEGARVGREVGTVAVSCWIPILAAPFAVAVCWNKWPAHFTEVPFHSWVAFLYCGLFSAFLGLFVWYRGLALGGTARIGQIQLAQPFFSLIVAGLLLHETLSLGDWITAVGVVTCVAVAQTAAASRASTATVAAEPA